MPDPISASPPLESGDIIPRLALSWGWELHGYHFRQLPASVYSCAMVVLAAHRLLRVWQYGEITHQEAGLLFADLRSHSERGSESLGDMERAGFPSPTSTPCRALGITAPSATHAVYRLGRRDLEEYIGRDGALRSPIDFDEPDRNHDAELGGLAVAMWLELKMFSPAGFRTQIRNSRLEPREPGCPVSSEMANNILAALAEADQPLVSTEIAKRAGYSPGSRVRQALSWLAGSGMVQLVGNREGHVITDKGRASLAT